MIRPGTLDDVPALLALERAAASAAHWSESAYRKIFSPDALRRTLFVYDGPSVAGFIVANTASSEWEIENVVVAPDFQRRGIGDQLVRALIAAAKAERAEAVLLEVRESNVAARRLYEKSGFVRQGLRKDYYRDPVESAVLYIHRPDASPR